MGIFKYLDFGPVWFSFGNPNPNSKGMGGALSSVIQHAFGASEPLWCLLFTLQLLPPGCGVDPDTDKGVTGGGQAAIVKPLG